MKNKVGQFICTEIACSAVTSNNILACFCCYFD